MTEGYFFRDGAIEPLCSTFRVVACGGQMDCMFLKTAVISQP